MKNKRINCETARGFSITKALEKLGHFPSRESEKEAWFLSPFRSETQASFKVSKIKNRWYDHGLGKGGNVIDLVCLIENYTVTQALDFLSQGEPSFSFQQPELFEAPEDQQIDIRKISLITHPALIQYLQSRKISLETAKVLCKEVHYSCKGKNYFAIGLPNASGGWELRNRYSKNSTSPKDISQIENGNRNLIATEGIFDMLSLLEIQPKLYNSHDFLVLNSTAFVERVFVPIRNYDSIDLLLDNDPTGRKKTRLLLEKSRNCIDRSALYTGFKDMNECLMKGAKDSVGQGAQDVFLLPQKQSCFAPDGCKGKRK